MPLPLCTAALPVPQPVTVIGVSWWISAPFWATSSVGICRGLSARPPTVFLTLRVMVFLRPWTLTVIFFLTVTVFVAEQRFSAVVSAL